MTSHSEATTAPDPSGLSSINEQNSIAHNGLTNSPFNYGHLYHSSEPGGEVSDSDTTSSLLQSSSILSTALGFLSEPSQVASCPSSYFGPSSQHVNIDPSQLFEQFIFNDPYTANDNALVPNGNTAIFKMTAPDVGSLGMYTSLGGVSEIPPFNECIPSSQGGHANHACWNPFIIGQGTFLHQDHSTFTSPPSHRPAPWIDSAPYASGSATAASNIMGVSIDGAQGFSDRELCNTQTIGDVNVPTGVNNYLCDDATRSSDEQVQEACDSPPELVEDKGTPEAMANHGTPEDLLVTSPESVTGALPVPIHRKKGPRMHRCRVCKKAFPRPSGLATHMNIHSGKRPYACIFPGCEQRFTVRSNAKRHLRVHGVDPSEIRPGPTPYIVNFNDPIIVHSVDTHISHPKRIRWVASSLKAYGNTGNLLRDASSEEDDEYDDGAIMVASNSPPEVVSPSDSSSGEASQPYHPIQWNGMPGRAI